jgi:glycosyltransferase involved in cell wall biosynthesis
LVGRTAFSVLNLEDRRMEALVRRTVSRRRFDVIQAESVQMAQYCLGAPAATVLDLHNIESVILKRYADCTRNPLKRAYAEITSRKLACYEKQAYVRFDQCLACSEEDRLLALDQTPEASVSVIPNGVDIDEAMLAPDGAPGRPRIVFVGRMDYHANVDGITWFRRSVWPRIQARVPDLLLQIVGGHPSPEVQRLEVPEEIEVTGFVPSVAPYLRDAAVVIVPLRVGGGTRLKALEALAMGKPIVSTSLGVEGIAVRHGENVLLADGEAEFADAVVRLVRDRAEASRIGLSGRRLVERRYDWNRIVEELEAVYEKAAAGRSGRHRDMAMSAS